MSALETYITGEYYFDKRDLSHLARIQHGWMSQTMITS